MIKIYNLEDIRNDLGSNGIDYLFTGKDNIILDYFHEINTNNHNTYLVDLQDESSVSDILYSANSNVALISGVPGLMDTHRIAVFKILKSFEVSEDHYNQIKDLFTKKSEEYNSILNEITDCYESRIEELNMKFENEKSKLMEEKQFKKGQLKKPSLVSLLDQFIKN